jgi:hypothetical protein
MVSELVSFQFFWLCHFILPEYCDITAIKKWVICMMQAFQIEVTKWHKWLIVIPSCPQEHEVNRISIILVSSFVWSELQACLVTLITCLVTFGDVEMQLYSLVRNLYFISKCSSLNGCLKEWQNVELYYDCIVFLGGG